MSRTVEQLGKKKGFFRRLISKVKENAGQLVSLISDDKYGEALDLLWSIVQDAAQTGGDRIQNLSDDVSPQDEIILDSWFEKEFKAINNNIVLKLQSNDKKVVNVGLLEIFAYRSILQKELDEYEHGKNNLSEDAIMKRNRYVDSVFSAPLSMFESLPKNKINIQVQGNSNLRFLLRNLKRDYKLPSFVVAYGFGNNERINILKNLNTNQNRLKSILEWLKNSQNSTTPVHPKNTTISVRPRTVATPVLNNNITPVRPTRELKFVKPTTVPVVTTTTTPVKEVVDIAPNEVTTAVKEVSVIETPSGEVLAVENVENKNKPTMAIIREALIFSIMSVVVTKIIDKAIK